MSKENDNLKWCAWDLDDRTVTIAFDTEDQVLNFINTYSPRHRHNNQGGEQPAPARVEIPPYRTAST